MSFFERLTDLCNQKNTTPTALCKTLKLSTSKVTAWKNGSIPSGDTLVLLSEFFDVSVDFLLKGNKISISTTSKEKVLCESPHIVAYFDFLGTKKSLKDNNVNLEELKNIYTTWRDLVASVGQQYKTSFALSELTKIQFFSDNVVIATEYTEETFSATLSCMISLMSYIQVEAFLKMKKLIRGGISTGKLYMDSEFIHGEALEEAYKLECSIANYPRIILSHDIWEKVNLKKEDFESIQQKTDEDFDGEIFINFARILNDKELTLFNKQLKDQLKERSLNEDSRAIQKIKWAINYTQKAIICRSKPISPRPRFYKIPIYEKVSAGTGTLANDSIKDYFWVSLSNEQEASETIFMEVKGNSMYPKIENKDIVQIHLQNEVRSGAIAVCVVESDAGDYEGYVKQVIYGSDFIELHSLNKKYKTKRYEGKAMKQVHVLGEVKKIIKDI